MTIAHEVLLRQVPPELADAVHAGAIKLFGSILRDPVTGRIAGFLQETGAAPKLMKALGSASVLDATPVGAAMRVADLGMGAAGLVQGEQIKAQLRLVSQLQIGNLLLTGAGIGVSLAGFAIMAAKIDAVGRKVDGLVDRLDALARSVEALRHDRIGEHLAELKTVAERYEEGWLPGGSDRHWRDTATDAHRLANHFARLATEVSQRAPDDLPSADPFLEALALAITLRINARLAAGDDAIALAAAEAGAQSLIEQGDRRQLARAAISRTSNDAATPGSPEWIDSLTTSTDTLRRSVDAARAREAACVSAAFMLQDLATRGIPGRRLLEEARDETDDGVKLLVTGSQPLA